MNSCRIFLLDDHHVFLDGLSGIISSREGLEVVQTFDRAEQLLEALKKDIPDLVISDISLPGMDGLEMAKQIRKRYPDLKIMLLSMHTHPKYVKPAVEAGVHGYIAKDSTAEEVIDAIHTIMKGGTFITPQILSTLLQPGNDLELTPREQQILQAIADGLSTREISEKLAISNHTVEAHRKNLLTKSGCNNVAQLVVWGIREGLLNEKKG